MAAAREPAGGSTSSDASTSWNASTLSGGWLLMGPPLGTSAWLARLRWFAVIGQLLTIALAVGIFDAPLPLVPLLSLVGFTAATNLAFQAWLGRSDSARSDSNGGDSQGPLAGSGPNGTGADGTGPGTAGDRGTAGDEPKSSASGSRVPPSSAAASGIAEGPRSLPIVSVLMLVDLMTLTAMLYLSGGVDNPFAFFYFVNLAVGGVILRPAWAWSLTAMAVAGFTLLLQFRLPVDVLSVAAPPQGTVVRPLGLLVAFATCASVITYFVTRMAEELTRRQRQLREAQDARLRSQQLEGLATLAAGAAHELASPLSTIAIVAREMRRHLHEVEVPESVRQDLGLIDSELGSCRQVLSRMRSAAGDHAAERWNRTRLGDLIDAVLEGVREPDRVEVGESVEAVEEVTLWLPLEAVALAIRNLVHNGLDASPAGAPVTLDAQVSDVAVTVRIEDHGEGMSPEVQRRLGEPFFTTKEPGQGMGLGLFLTRNVVSRLGGRLQLDSRPGRGTVAAVTLPRRESFP